MPKIRWFDFRSREEREQDYEDYRKGCFPQGEKQKAALTECLKHLVPSEPPTVAMAAYLAAHDAFCRQKETDLDAAYEAAKRAAEKVVLPAHKKDAAWYAALVLADVEAEKLPEWPAAEWLLQRAEKTAAQYAHCAGKQ